MGTNRAEAGEFARRQITDHQLAKYSKLIYERTGVRISPQKKSLLSNRVQRRLRATGIDDYGAYLQKLVAIAADDPEWDAFLQEITTHETYLFRDAAHWEWFQQSYLPDLARNATRKSLRIWSAACSTGDEAFTIASCVAGVIRDHAQWQVEILGSDVGIGAVARAREARFSERAMRLVPADYERRFFRQQGDVWEAKPPLTQWTRFQQHNLIEPLHVPAFDLVVVKNVLIYFDEESKAVVMDHVKSAIRPGGLLLTGAAEGIGGLLGDFERIHAWLHRKPA